MKIKAIKKILWVSAITVLLLSFLPHLIANFWFLDILSSFKFQYFVISIVVFLISAFLFKNKIKILCVIMVALIWNGLEIAPYYISYNKQNTYAKERFKVTSINLLSSNKEVSKVEKFISAEQPDVLVLMELTPRWEKDLKQVITNYTYRKIYTRNDNFGIAILSNYNMSSQIEYFGSDKPSILSILNISGEKYTIIATHPVPPINQYSFKNRNEQLKSIVANQSSNTQNLIIIGDFNLTSFSNQFGQLLKGNLKDSRIGFGLLPTWPANYKLFQTTLDHCLVSKNLEVISRTTGSNIGSDHLPISVTIKKAQ